MDWRVWALALIIPALTVLVYLPSLKNGFTNWDDPTYVTENQLITSLDSEHIRALFREPVSLNYHPITMLSLALDYHSNELNPRGYHATNLLFHALNTLLVFLFFYLLTGKRWIIAAVTSLLFAIHPMHVESVAWISERKDVLYVFFYLLALIFYVRYLDTGKWLWLLAAFLPFGLSLLSKAVAVTVPVVFLGIDYLRKRPFSWKLVLEKIPFLILSLIMGIIAYQIQSQGAIAKPGVLTLVQRFIFASYGFWMYVYKMFVPLNLATFYPYPSLDVPGGSLPMIYNLSPIISLALLGLAAFTWKRTRVIVFGFFFYLVTVALVLQFISVGNAVMADRYSYLAYLGLFFIVGYGIDKAWTEKSGLLPSLKIPALIGILAFSVWFIALTSRQIKVWEHNGSLWTQVIDHYPTGWVAYKNRGNYYGQKGETEKAMADYQVLIQNKQVDGQVWANLGNIYRMKNQFDKALDAYEKAYAMDPRDINNSINRGIIYSILKRYEEAIPEFDRALALGSLYAKVGPNKAYTLLSMGRYEEALREYGQVIQSMPPEATHFQNRGLAYFNLNRFGEALGDFDQALRLAPTNPELLYNLSVVHYKMNRLPQAFDYARQAREKGYPVPESYFNELSQKNRGS